jgi:general secretion pathway protein G
LTRESTRQATHAAPPAGAANGAGHDAGFTLLELLVVIAILGLLVAFVAPAALRQLGGAKTNVARQQVERLGSVLDLYKLDVGGYPTSEQGLASLTAKPSDVENWNGPYLKDGQEPRDPWNHPWLYRNPSNRTGHDYDLCSPGADGRGTGPGEGDAICNP